VEVHAAGGSRVQQRTYLFTDSNEQMPYALYVSSKVSKEKKNPRSFPARPRWRSNTMVRSESFKAIDTAGEGGYILLSPMGLQLRRVVWHTGRRAARR
jgi:hypothetical protein